MAEVGVVVRALLPGTVRVGELDPRDVDPAGLHPDEHPEIARAVDTRRRQYAAGRLLAARLLRELGVSPAPLRNGPDRAPMWPVGVVGSITHCATWCAVAVAPAEGCTGLGVDVEPWAPLPPGVDEVILTAADREALSAVVLPDGFPEVAGRLVFSAKEAVYKALYPRIRQVLDFPDVHVALAADGRFTATLTRGAPPFMRGARFDGRYGGDGRHLATAVWLA